MQPKNSAVPKTTTKIITAAIADKITMIEEFPLASFLIISCVIILVTSLYDNIDEFVKSVTVVVLEVISDTSFPSDTMSLVVPA